MLPKRRQPTHPGIILLEDFLKPKGMTVKQLAETLGSHWNEDKLNVLIAGKENFPKNLSEQLGKVLGPSTEFWLRLQQRHHEWIELHGHHAHESEKPWKKAQ